MKETQQPKHKAGEPRKTDAAVLEIARALARQAAREDHDREQTNKSDNTNG